MSFNYLEVIIFIFLLTMAAYGYSKGLLKLSVMILALLSSVIALNAVNPYLREKLQNNTELEQFVLTTVYEKIGVRDMNGDSSNAMGRSMEIDGLNIPTKIKDILKKNDNRVMYERLNVHTFTDYVAGYVTQMMINAMSFVGSFALVWLILGILFKGNKLLEKIPMVDGLNQLFGAAAGLLIGLIAVWVLCIFIIAFSTTKFGSELSSMVEKSQFLLFLSKLNPVAIFLGLS